jgi:hypothetical protein
MTRDSIKSEIENATQSLLKMAREMSYNNISHNLSFIIHKVDDGYSQVSNYFKKYALRKKINDAKPVLTLEEAINELKNYFEDIYEINLYVYKAEKTKTIIEIEITEKDRNGFIREGTPFLHCKVAIPPYADEPKQKFDINWQFGSCNSKWKMFWWKRKINQELIRLRKRHIT